MHGPNLGGLSCNRWCDPLRWVSFTGALCRGLCVSSVCLLCVSVVRERVCSIFGVCVLILARWGLIPQQSWCLVALGLWWTQP